LEALAALQRAHELAPEDEYTRQLLIDTMLQFLAEDFAAHRHYVAEIQRLDPSADQRGEFLRLLIGGYQEVGEPEKAFEACLKLAGLDAEEGIGATRAPMDQIGVHLTVRRDRWIRARMKELIDAAEGDHRAAIDRSLAERLDDALASDAPSSLSRFINYFGSHPSADRARLRLADKLIESSSLLEAELLLVRLENSADPQIAAPANWSLAKLMARAQRWGEAASYYRRLQDRWPDAELENGQTASEIVGALPGEGPLAAALRGPHSWPTGRVESKTTEERLTNINSFQKVYPIELTQLRGGLPQGVRLAYDQQQVQLQVRDADGRASRPSLSPIRTRVSATRFPRGIAASITPRRTGICSWSRSACR
jgi:tetratricopeptide (TPR) repeat protein